MPGALKSTCLITFWSWMNTTFPLLTLRGNKNWLLSMKVKEVEHFLNKMGLMGCKWFSLNARSIKIYLSYHILELGEYH